MNHSTTASETKSKKKRKNKKKNTTAAKVVPDAKPHESHNVQEEHENGDEESEASDREHEQEESDVQPIATSETSVEDDPSVATLSNGTNNLTISSDMAAATARFDALVRDRDALREEVTRLRESLEEVQNSHEQQMQDIQAELQDEKSERETAEENYQNLLQKVNTIREQLGDRLKADAEDLTQARTRIEELEEQKADLQEQYTSRSREVEELTGRHKEQANELDTLRGRASLSQQNWEQERTEMVEQETYLREEFESAKQAMHDWEVLATEERSIRRDLADRVADLEEQLTTTRTEYERLVAERETQENTVEGLQKAMQEIQNARKRELRELVESSQNETTDLQKQFEQCKTELKTAVQELEETQKELDRLLPFEKEVREKNLQIGKLRRDEVILKDHLTKALRFLKKGKPDDNVDRQIVTNHFLHFLALDRSDPKKFQILQLIAALLNWTDEQKEQAGLTRPGGAPSGSTGGGGWGTGSLRLPGTPMMRRAPSSPSLSNMIMNMDATSSPSTSMSAGMLNPGGEKETLAELWQSFLEQESGSANATVSASGGKSRSPSMSTTGNAATSTSTNTDTGAGTS